MTPVTFKGFALQPLPFRKMDWSITSRCDWSCPVCPRTAQSAGWRTCRTCLRRSDAGPECSSEELAEMADRIVALGVAGINIRGGNPLLAWSRLERVLEALRPYSEVVVLITTPGTGRPVKDVLRLYERPKLSLNVVIPAIEGCDASGQVKEAGRLCDALAKKNLPFSLTYLISAGARENRDRLTTAAHKRWRKVPWFAELGDKAAFGSATRLTHLTAGGKPIAAWRSPEDLHNRVRRNACLNGSFELGVDNTVWPCLGINQKCGQVVRGDLRSGFTGDALSSLWMLAKADVEPCSRCAMRLTCSDCTETELLAKENSEAHGAYCSFQPEGPVRASDTLWRHNGFLRVLRVSDGRGGGTMREAVRDTVIELEGVRKTFRQIVALDDLSLSVQGGEIVGFIGPNGSGKTTTIRLMLGLYRPDGGRVSVMGHDPLREFASIGPLLGVMLEQPGIHDHLTAAEYLEYYAGLFGIRPAESKARRTELLEKVGLAERANHLLRGFSKGMRQRLNLARCLLNRPRLLLLDEPFDGVDVEARRDILKLLPSIVSSEGSAIFLTSHNLPEVEKISSRVVIVKSGRIVAQGDPGVLRQSLPRKSALVVTLAPGGASPDFDIPGASYDEKRRVLRIELSASQTRDQVLRAILDRGHSISALSEEVVTLEDVYFSAMERS